MVKEFWNNKKVLITGHTGFKGAWLCLWLSKLGAKVSGYSLAPENPSLYKLLSLDLKVDSYIADIRNYQEILRVLSKVEPEIVIHMAAQPLVRLSYSQPIETYETNIMGTLYLLDAARKLSSIKAIVNVTTDKCYENRNRIEGYKEDEPLGGYDPYSSSKACSEIVSSAYRRSFQIPLATARSGNVIGGGDYAVDRLIPDIFLAISKGQKLKIRNPYSVRPWQHVLEPLSGYLLLAQKIYQNESVALNAFNFGPEKDDLLTVEKIVKKIQEKWPSKLHYYIEKEEKALHESSLLALDCNKAKQLLGWYPKWRLDYSLEKIVEWYTAAYSCMDSAIKITEKQIEEYENT